MRSDITWERRLSTILAGGIIICFLFLLWNPPELNSATLPIIRFLAATIAGLVGYLFSGSLRLEGKLPFSGLQIKAGSAFAAFIIVFILFYAGISTDQPPSNRKLFSSTDIVQNIKNPIGDNAGEPVIATENGNGAILTVEAKNIPKKASASSYKLVSFSRKSDNPNWDYQGVADLSGEPVSVNLKLWSDPAGDKSFYEAVSIISSSFNESGPKVYTPYDLDRYALKKSSVLTFFRDDFQT